MFYILLTDFFYLKNLFGLICFKASRVNGRIPILEKKQKLDFDDTELLKLASYIGSLSKQICKSSEQSIIRKLNITNMDTNFYKTESPEPTNQNEVCILLREII